MSDESVMKRPFDYGRTDGWKAARDGHAQTSYGTAYFNDAGAQMEYRDGYRAGWVDYHKGLWEDGTSRSGEES